MKKKKETYHVMYKKSAEKRYTSLRTAKDVLARITQNAKRKGWDCNCVAIYKLIN